MNSFYINGQPPKTNTKTLNTSSTVGVRIGAHVSSGEMAEFDALEIMAFSTALPVEDRQKVEGYLAHKWGMAGVLPLDHPYKGYAPGGAPEIANEAASGISLTAATINGGLVSTGTAETAVIAYWGETDGGTDASAWANTNQLGIATQAQQSFSVPLTGLAMGTTYYYRFAATNDVGLAFAPSSASFTTLPSEPQVANGAATDVLNTSAMISGTVTYLGAPPTTLYAFWATNDCGADASAWLENGDSVNLGTPPEGSETAAALAGLLPNTVYYYNFMASNDYAMAWGTTSAAPSFRTPGAPGLSGVGADLVMDTTARLNATLDDGNEARVYFTWGTAADALVTTNDLGVVPMGYHPVNLTGLSLTTTYYFQAHAENSYGSVSSAVTSFSTIGTIAEWTSIADGMWTNPATWNVPGVPRAGAPVTVNHAVTLDVATPELSSVTVNVGKTLTFDGWDTVLTADTVTISGTVTHVQNTDTNGIDGWTPDARVNIVCEDLTIGADGGIDVRGKGFKGGVYPQHGNGPGGGRTTQHRGGGAGHGDHGSGLLGGGYLAYGGVAYGSASMPEQPGSGGGASSHTTNGGGAGGGLVQIFASGNAEIGGAINANGANGLGLSGAGSGGGVYVQCATMSGSGAITANGGTAYVGGSGGRIAIDITDPTAQALLEPEVQFSSESSFANADTKFGHGSLYFTQMTFFPYETLSFGSYVLHLGDTELIEMPSLAVTAGKIFLAGGLALYLEGDLTVANSGTKLVLTNANIDCRGNLAVGNGAELQLHSSPTNGVSPNYGNRVDVSGTLSIYTNGLLSVYSHPTNGGSMFLDVATLRIFKDGTLSANAGGFHGRLPTGGRGPGGGLTSGADRGGGGSYGGKGATSTHDSSRPARGGPTYGSANLPLLCGSAGGRNGGRGGGLIWLHVRGTTLVDGAISANGGIAPSNMDGDGSGGGVFIDCARLLGEGSISADGGLTSGTVGANGGGGRVAIWEGVPEVYRSRYMSGNFGSARISEEPFGKFTGTATATAGVAGFAGELAEPGSVVFLTSPPSATTLMLR